MALSEAIMNGRMYKAWLGKWPHANGIVRGDHERTDVQSMVGKMGHPVLVEGNELAHAFDEQFLRYLGHLHAVRRAVETVKVVKRTENGYLATRQRVSFDAFKNGLPVMPGRIAGINLQRLVGLDLRLAPLAIFIFGNEHVVGKYLSKRDIFQLHIAKFALVGFGDLHFGSRNHSMVGVNLPQRNKKPATQRS